MSDIGDAFNFLFRGIVPVDAHECSTTKAIDKYCPNGGGFDVSVCCGIKGEALKPTSNLPEGHSHYPKSDLFFDADNFFIIRAYGRGLNIEKLEIEMYIGKICQCSFTIQPQEKEGASLFETGMVLHPAKMTVDDLPKTVDFFLAKQASRKQKKACKELFTWLHPAILALQKKILKRHETNIHYADLTGFVHPTSN